MKPTGAIVSIDEMGRILIPKPIRKMYDMQFGDKFEIFAEKDSLVMKKYMQGCTFCGSYDDVIEYKDKNICVNCAKELFSLAEQETE